MSRAGSTKRLVEKSACLAVWLIDRFETFGRLLGFVRFPKLRMYSCILGGVVGFETSARLPVFVDAGVVRRHHRLLRRHHHFFFAVYYYHMRRSSAVFGFEQGVSQVCWSCWRRHRDRSS